MQRWTLRQWERRMRNVPAQGMLDLDMYDPPPTDSWERALDTAREEIRALIADGEIANDQITAGWIAEWAANR